MAFFGNLRDISSVHEFSHSQGCRPYQDYPRKDFPGITNMAVSLGLPCLMQAIGMSRFPRGASGEITCAVRPL